jgi:RNA polymerase sigma factor (sigma-70 family)
MNLQPPNQTETPGHAPDTTDLREALVAQLSVVESVTAYICHRRRLSADEADEFAAHVRLKLVENDYGILRQFQGRSSLRTYLTTVIERVFLDYRTAQWGRWRPSVEAKRGGSVGVLLDRLLNRDGMTFDEAYQAMQTNYSVTMSRDELYALSVRLPARVQRRAVADTFSTIPAADGSPERALEREEAARLAGAVKAALKQAFSELPADDRRLLEMRFREGRQVVDIAQTLGTPSKPLYRRLEQIVRTLRRPLAVIDAGQPGLGSHLFRLSDVSISW